MKAVTTRHRQPAENETFTSATTIAALLFLAAKFPHRQFNSAELAVLSGIGRTAMSQTQTSSLLKAGVLSKPYVETL